MTPDEIKLHILAEVKRRGLHAIATELGVNRTSVSSYVMDCCRPGTAALIAQKYAEKQRSQAPSVDAFCSARAGRSLGISHR